MEEKKKWRTGCAVIALLFVAGMGLMLAGAFRSARVRPAALTVFTGEQIAVIRIEEPVFSPDLIVERLEQCRDDKNVKAVVLRINSPGGGVAACQEVYESVKRVKAAGKKVAASLGGVAASGAYYIACASDTILANPGTVTGSIGVIFEFPYFYDLMKKVGVDMEIIKSGKYKDAGSFHRKLTPEERRLFQDLINDTWEQFVDAVARGRGLSPDSVKAMADGRVFTGRQAKARGLVDTLGTFEDAKSLAKKMAGLPEEAEIFEFRAPRGVMKWLVKEFAETVRQKASLTAPGLLYLFTE